MQKSLSKKVKFMKSTKPTRAKFFLLASILCVTLIFVFPGFANTASAQNNPPDLDLMEDLMDEIMGEIRDEVNQEIKTEVRQDTTETVAEETLSPSNTFSGVYIGTVLDGGEATCNFMITQSGFSARCDTLHTEVIVTGTGGNLATSFDFTYRITEEPAGDDSGCGPDTGLGTATLISGNGEPGTIIEVKLFGPNDCIDDATEVIIFVKQ